MRTLLTITLTTALVANGVGQVRGQSAPLKEETKRPADDKKAADERKAAEERLRYAREIQEAHNKLRAELEARTAELLKLQEQRVSEERKMAVEAHKEATITKFKTPETPRAPVVAQPPPMPPAPPTGGVRWLTTEPTAADPLAAIKPLIRSDDPKVAALAAQLAEALAKKTPQAKPVAVAGQLVLEGGGQTFRLESKPGATSEPLKVVVSTDKVVKVAETYSSLRMSADGKTAAVIAADGSVTVFDTASGKELMRFPVKK